MKHRWPSLVHMRELQNQIIREMGVAPEIDPAAEVERRVQFLGEYLVSTGAQGFVLGISGGVDSTTAGRLCQLAVEQIRANDPDSSVAFTALRLPYRTQHDEDDAQRSLRFIRADEEATLQIGPAVDALAEDVDAALGAPLSDYHRGNVKARMRMIAQYAIAGERGALVVGTDHAAESVTGFFTKFGDGGADVLPLFGLNKRQVRAVAQYLGADETLWAKVPTADLLTENPGRTDEDELGLRYDDIDDYLEGRDIDAASAERLETIYLRTRHKRTTPTTILDTWWR